MSSLGIFGVPTSFEKSKIILLPVPWEVTTSYGAGASDGPALIREASEQVDLYDFEVGNAYEAGYHMLDIPSDLKAKNDKFKAKAQKLIEMIADLDDDIVTQHKLAEEINKACDEMTAWVHSETAKNLSAGKIPGLIGGDHSTPLGAIRAVAEKYKGDFAVLHFDAHADLRKAYQGLTHSHASIMYNVMNSEQKPAKLVQVGIRDFSEEEKNLIESRKDIKTFFDIAMKRRMLAGESWAAICKDILKELPKNVYISIDIDGLDPQFCPHTGTPVPGGLSLDQVFYLFHELAESGRHIVGFDLNEVSTGGDRKQAEWDGNVGARMLYKLCGWAVKTNSKS